MNGIEIHQKTIPPYINSKSELREQKQKSEQELIEKHSLLQNYDKIPALFNLDENKKNELKQQLIDNKKLFAHVLLDNFSKNSDHEGMQAEYSIRYMKSLADVYCDKQKPENPTVKNIATQLSNALFWEQKINTINILKDPKDIAIKKNIIAQTIAADIKALTTGQNFWLSGGYYKNGSGHSMYFRFFKREDGNYDIYI